MEISDFFETNTCNHFLSPHVVIARRAKLDAAIRTRLDCHVSSLRDLPRNDNVVGDARM